MKVIYPESWAGLEFPDQRENLISILRDLVADDEAQLRANQYHGDLTDEAYHFLFDDTAIARNPELLIGVVFLNEKEAEHSAKLTSTLRELRPRSEITSGDILRSAPNWHLAQAAAHDLLRLLLLKGEPKRSFA